jgi:diguanylate cyclase (GGDEF)-like protein
MAAEQCEEVADMGRDISGFYTRMLLHRLAVVLTAEDIESVLADAGETRSVGELNDASSWSSHAQFQRLLQAASRRNDLPAGIGDVEATEATLELEFAEIIRSFGSPQGVMAGGTGENPLVPCRGYEMAEVEANEWVVREWFLDGFDPYPEFCALVALQYRAIPIYFGLERGEVTEEQCQCRGDDACVFRVRWDETDESTDRPEDLAIEVELLKGRLAQLQSMVTDLASNERYEDILQGIVSSTSSALGAAGALLVVHAHAESARRIYAQGMSAEEAERMADQLTSGQATSKAVSVEVASARRSHGILAIDERGGIFTSQSKDTLQTYGQLAAAALDSVRAWEEARHQANTAQILLKLAESLAEIVSTDEMAVRIAEAVPSLVDCDRVGVFLFDSPNEGPNPEGLRLAASYGYPDEAVEILRDRYVKDSSLNPDTISNNGILQTALSDVGTTASVSAPITSGWTLIGYIVAGVTSGPERLTVTPRLAERLKGLAAQASIAISNARLLDQIRYQALHDTLTGLPNRALILDRAEQMLARGRRNYLPVAVLYLDLDGFKDVNDRLGHSVGDRLLRAVTQRLLATMRESDTIGRLGGDEFVVLVDGSTMDAGPELVAERLLGVLREPFVLEGTSFGPLSLSASIGIAAGTRSSASELLRDADTALYEAKGGGKNRYVMFQPEMQTAIQDRLVLEMDLREALGADQFFLVYQPIFNLASGQTTGVEALLRWRHPTRGTLQPDAFVPLLEDSGLIVEVGRWVLAEACKRGSRWHAIGHHLDISVNVSARQLETDEGVDDLLGVLRNTGFPPESLILEITETAIMRNVTAVIPRLKAMKSAGARIAIDDFGTGYSSLSYLQQFPVDTIKIDRSFIASMVDSPQSGALVRTLVQLGKTLGLETLAEGIEEIEQYSLLENVRCDSGQGYLIARPLEAEAVEAFLTMPAGVGSPGPLLAGVVEADEQTLPSLPAN